MLSSLQPFCFCSYQAHKKNDAKHIPKISVRLSVNNVLAKNWSTFRQMQTLDKVTNFSLNHGIKIYLLFCSLHLVFKTGGWTFPLIASIQVSSLHLKFLNCFQLTEYFVIKGFKNSEKKKEQKRNQVLFFCVNKEQTDPLGRQEKYLQQ